MAIMGSTTTTRCPVAYGRSGYNKDGKDDGEDDKFRNYSGRSGYNKDGNDGEEDNQFRNFGRSGYNKGGKGGDDEDQD